MRGHHVTLFEKSDRFGGQLNIARLAPNRVDLDGRSMAQYQLLKLDVELRLGTEATVESVLANSRMRSLSPPAPFLSSAHTRTADCGYAASAWDVLLGRAPAGKRVIVIDDQADRKAPAPPSSSLTMAARSRL